jgi:ATP-dependent protease ClpP protease subunit
MQGCEAEGIVNKRRRGLLAALDPAVQFAMQRSQGVTARALPPGLAVRPRTEAGVPAELMIYGRIGGGGWFDEGITGADVANALREAGPGPLNVRINSGGGDVFDGVAIHSLLARHPGHVAGTVDGLAASAASFIMLACDTIKAPKSAFVMIHDAMTMPYGNANTLRSAADLLDQVSGTIAEMYADRAGEDAAYWRERMTENGEDGTWYNGAEAYDAGLVDEVITSAKGEDDVEASVMKHLDGWRDLLPTAIAAKIKMPPAPIEDANTISVPEWDAAAFREVLKGALL